MTIWTNPSQLDRLPNNRLPEDLDELWEEAAIIQIDPAGMIRSAAGQPELVADAGSRQPGDIFLGRLSGRAWFVRQTAEITGEKLSWREAPLSELDPLAAAVALTRWHGTAPRCENCGEPTQPDLGGARRSCVSCGALLFPRTDPCVIVAITDANDRLLLARQRVWAPHRASIIAGFIEAGESAEQACRREVAEEVGIQLTTLQYVSSQPWPMPRSLMLGFLGRTTDEDVVVDGEEIAEGRFYTRHEARAAIDAEKLVLPGVSSIARQLIDSWLRN